MNPHKNPYFLYVGNIKPHKNLGTLIRAFNSLVEDFPYDLVLVGKREGFITGDSATILRAGEQSGRVHFTDHVDDGVLKQYMAHAEALVFPSLYEGFGLPPLEAMAAGCPVIASSAASIPEICGDAALYCDPHSSEDIAGKIRLLAGDVTLRNELRRKGVKHAKQFTWDSCIIETCRVVDGLLSLIPRKN